MEFSYDEVYEELGKRVSDKKEAVRQIPIDKARILFTALCSGYEFGPGGKRLLEEVDDALKTVYHLHPLANPNPPN